MKYVLLLLLILSTLSHLHAQDVSYDNTSDYQDTLLKGGYAIKYFVDDSLQHLFLKKNKKTITELSTVSKGLQSKNLGYVWSDFPDCFVFVNAYGPCNPIYAQLINKKSGRNLFKHDVALLDVDDAKKIILYTSDTGSLSNMRLTLFDINSGRKETFKYPQDIDESAIYCSIQILKLTSKELAIKYQTVTSGKIRVYKRH